MVDKYLFLGNLKARMKQKTQQNAVTHFPYHTQAVERAIKLVTEASMLVIGSAERDRVIRNRIESRKKIAKFETKKDFFG